MAERPDEEGRAGGLGRAGGPGGPGGQKRSDLLTSKLFFWLYVSILPDKNNCISILKKNDSHTKSGII